MLTIQRQTTKQKIIRYFEGAGLDYYYWDKAFNMHFGYFKWGVNPLNRTDLLRTMNKVIGTRLRLDRFAGPLVLDLGCGLGAVSRDLARRQEDAVFLGFTITPWQVTFGNELTREEGLADRVHLYESDFSALPLGDESADAAFAAESACYAAGPDKRAFAAELYRVLKPGGRFVVTDGFRKHSQPLPRWLQGIYQNNLACWALTELADIQRFTQALRAEGFRKVKVEDISWRVAPSFAHIPFVSLRFYWDLWRKGELAQLDPERKKNVLAPLLGMIMGLSRRHFGYYLVSGEK